MTARDFDTSIRSSSNFLNECKLLRTAKIVKSLSASEEFRELAFTPTTLYRDLFLCGLRNGDYNLLLSDYAYFQFRFFAEHRYRFAYYPNPFVNNESTTHDLDEQVRKGVISFEEYSNLLSEEPYEMTRPPIRFELDCNAYVRLIHPAAHFHIGMHEGNRWPVCRRLTPRGFSLLIAKLYYDTAWAHGEMRSEKDGFMNRFDKHFVTEKSDCHLLGGDLFHEQERGQMHFT